MSHNEMNFKVKFTSYSSKYANNKNATIIIPFIQIKEVFKNAICPE